VRPINNKIYIQVTANCMLIIYNFTLNRFA
jgi:hypothetical protein